MHAITRAPRKDNITPNISSPLASITKWSSHPMVAEEGNSGAACLCPWRATNVVPAPGLPLPRPPEKIIMCSRAALGVGTKYRELRIEPKFTEPKYSVPCSVPSFQEPKYRGKY
jgi:hypothetical protein